MNKIKIVYILPSLDKGGAERFLTDLILNLNREIFEPTLILFKWGGEWLAELEAAGIPVKIFNKKYKFDWHNFWQIFFALKKIKPEIVHTQLGGDIYGRLAAKMLGVPVILSTEQNVNKDENKIICWLKKITNLWADKIVAISKAVRNDIIVRYQTDPEKITIIPNGLEINKFLSQAKNPDHQEKSANQPLTFGTIGRLSPQKGQTTLINAWAKLENDKINCLIAGVGPLQAQLNQQISSLKLKNKIKLVGAVSNPATFLSSLDAFILPSIWEGQGIVLLEAGLIGLPIIASAVDGITEIINKETGWTVPASDVSALAKSVDWLGNNLDGPEVKAKTEKLRSQIIAAYDIKKITRDYEGLYHSLLKNKNLL